VKTTTIKITVPKSPAAWAVSIGVSRYKKKSAASAYAVVEKNLKGKKAGSLGTSNVYKVFVNYGNGDNSGEYATSREALWALACFLEDFLTPDLLAEKLRKYER